MNQASSNKKSRRDDEGDRKRAAAAQHHRMQQDGDGDNNGCWLISLEELEVPMKVIVTTRNQRSMTDTREWEYIKYPKPIVSLKKFLRNKTNNQH